MTSSASTQNSRSTTSSRRSLTHCASRGRSSARNRRSNSVGCASATTRSCGIAGIKSAPVRSSGSSWCSSADPTSPITRTERRPAASKRPSEPISTRWRTSTCSTSRAVTRPTTRDASPATRITHDDARQTRHQLKYNAAMR